MGLTPEIERALGLCYDAVVAPVHWSEALDRLARSLGAEACFLLLHDPAERPSISWQSFGTWKFNELWERNIDWATDVYAPRGVPLVREGHHALVQSQLFSDEEISLSAFHQEIARPAGCLHWASSCFTVHEQAWCLPVFRSTTPFCQREAEQLADVSPHLARIVSLAGNFACGSAEAEITALDKVGCAAMLIDSRGRVVRTNHHAEELLGPEFGIRNGRPWTSDRPSLARLNRLLSAIQCAKQSIDPCHPLVVIARHGVPWLLVESMPVTALGNDIFGGARAILAISDLTRPPVSDAAALQLVFGLTVAEARVAVAIYEGRSLDEVAKSFGVGRETVRSQLKAVFAKTGSRSQAQLVARVTQIRIPSRH